MRLPPVEKMVTAHPVSNNTGSHGELFIDDEIQYNTPQEITPNYPEMHYWLLFKTELGIINFYRTQFDLLI